MARPDRTHAALVGAALLAASLAIPRSAEAAPRCFGKKATIVGTGGRDVIRGTPRRDVIMALGGRDKIVGKAGDDLICAGGGNDTIRAKSGDDRINGGPGGDSVFGHSGNDEMIGKSGGDALLGGPGNDRMLGGQGFDLMIGGAGDDLYEGGGSPFDAASFAKSPVGVVVDLNVLAPQNTGEGLDTITGTEGVFGSAFNDALTGQDIPSATGNGLFGLQGTDQLLGLDGDDVLEGGPGNDKGGPGIGLLNGGAGNDFLFGEEGDDDLYGEAGNDVLDGFEGADFGSGGPDFDQCFDIETFDAPPPEELPAGDTCQPAVPRMGDALDSLDRWTSVRARWGQLTPAG